MAKFGLHTWTREHSGGERMNKDQERAVQVIGALIKSFAFYPQSHIQRLTEVPRWREPV